MTQLILSNLSPINAVSEIYLGEVWRKAPSGGQAGAGSTAQTRPTWEARDRNLLK